jgi:hypothetical protein
MARSRGLGDVYKRQVYNTNGQVGGLPVPKGGAYGGGIWANPDGTIYGYAMTEDGRITKTKPPGWDERFAPKPASLTKSSGRRPRRGRGKVGSGISGAHP